MTRGILFCVVALATSVVYGSEEPKGVAAVNVALKQNPKKKAVTDAQGNFVLSALPAGSYTLFVWGPSAKDLHQTTGSVLIVATSYSIKVEGAKRSADQSARAISQHSSPWPVIRSSEFFFPGSRRRACRRRPRRPSPVQPTPGRSRTLASVAKASPKGTGGSIQEAAFCAPRFSIAPVATTE